MTSPSMKEDPSTNHEDKVVERLSKQVDLPAYLAHRGYRYESAVTVAGLTTSLIMSASKPSVTPRRLLLGKDPESGGWSFADASEPERRGTIVDYLQRHAGLPYPAAVTRLADLVDRTRQDVLEAVSYRAHIASKPLALREAEMNHEFFVRQQRGVVTDLARLGITGHSSLETAGICEIGQVKDRFPPIQRPADVARLVEEPQQLWHSAYARTDQRVVLVERPVDAISYSQRHKDPHACYLAVGSQLTAERQRELGALLSQMPKGMSVVAAFGRDQSGRQLVEQVRSVAPGVQMTRAEPQFGSTWSNQMQLEARHRRSMAPREAGMSR